MPSAMFDAMKPQQNSLQAQLAQFRAQFAPQTDPMQIIQQMLQQGRITQNQLNAVVAQAQQMFPNQLPNK